MKPKVLITTNIDHLDTALIDDKVQIVQGPDPDVPMTRAEVLAQVSDVAFIVNQNELKIDKELLAKAGNLKVVANTTAGFDNMDISAMTAAGVWGTNCPSDFAGATADHTMCMMLAIMRRLIPADNFVRSGDWPIKGWTPSIWAGNTLEGKALGLIGYGAIGKKVARRAEGFGMDVSFHSKGSETEPGYKALDELLTTSDVISLHCPLTPATHHLISRRELKMMKSSSWLVNVSRGPVVDQSALVEALENDWIKGAGCDVFEFEPDVDPRLFKLNNIVMSPHLGGATHESFVNAWQNSFANIASFLHDQTLISPVNTLG